MNIYFNGSYSISSDSTPENTFIEYRLQISYRDFVEFGVISDGLVFSKDLNSSDVLKISEPSSCKIVKSVLDDAIETSIWLKNSGEPKYVSESVLPICCNVSLLCKGNLLAYSNLLFALEKSKVFRDSTQVISTLQNHLPIFFSAVNSTLRNPDNAK